MSDFSAKVKEGREENETHGLTIRNKRGEKLHVTESCHIHSLIIGSTVWATKGKGHGKAREMEVEIRSITF